jgi:hypothetical protein
MLLGAENKGKRKRGKIQRNNRKKEETYEENQKIKDK